MSLEPSAQPALRNLGLAVVLTQAQESGDSDKLDSLIEHNSTADIISGLIDTMKLAIKILEPDSGINLNQMLDLIWNASQGTQGLTPDQVINGPTR